MRSLVAAAFGLALAGGAWTSSAQAADTAAVSAPAFKVGDSWVFDQTTEKRAASFQQLRLNLVVERLSEDSMMVGIKPDGSPRAFEDHLVGQDWSIQRLVDGKQTTTTRPFTFPMAVGASWTVDFIDQTRRGAQVSNHVHRVYKVVGWESVTVPAGTFRAMKVEAKGVDNGVVEVAASAAGGVMTRPGGSTAVTHTQKGGQSPLVRETYAEFYYVPELKNYVKTIEEQYTTDSVRVSRETRLLVSSKMAD